MQRGITPEWDRLSVFTQPHCLVSASHVGYGCTVTLWCVGGCTLAYPRTPDQTAAVRHVNECRPDLATRLEQAPLRRQRLPDADQSRDAVNPTFLLCTETDISSLC